MFSIKRGRPFQTIILIFFIGLSLLSFFLVDKIAQSRSQEIFQVLVDESLTSLDRRFDDYSRILDGIAGFVVASDEVTAVDMSNYANALNLTGSMSEIDAIGLAVDPTLEKTFPNSSFELGENTVPFDIGSPKLRTDHFVVRYIEPLVSHEALLELNFAKNPNLLRIARESRETVQILASANLTELATQYDRSKAFLLKPIFRPSKTTYPIEQSKGIFLGFAFTVLNVEDIFKDLTKSQDNLIDIKIETNVYLVDDKIRSISEEADDVPDYITRSSIEKFGRIFPLSWNSTKKFDSIQPFRAKWIVLALGFIITTLVSAILNSLIRRNSEIEIAVTQKTQELETQAEEKRSILENAMLAILSVDKSGRILHANEAALKILWPLGGRVELTDMLVSELLPELNLEKADRWTKICINSNIGKSETSVIEVEMKTWFTAANEARTTLLLRDITVTERHAQEIVEAEQRWNLALMGAQIGVFDINLDRETSVVSDTWFENIQMEAVKCCKNPYREQLIRIHPDDLVLFKNAEDACLEGRTDRAVVSFRVQGVNKAWRWIKSEAVVVERAPDGTALRMIGIQMDVTESFELERMKRDFVATVSHELRTPLTSIKGALGLLHARMQGEKFEGTDRLIEIALSNSDRLASLVNDILDMEKMNSGNMTHEIKAVALDEVLSEASREVETYAVQWNVKLEVTELGIENMISTDKKRVIQVLTNLLSNACKFADADTKVRLSAEILPNHIKILVRNFGPGIPEEFRNRIFQPFSQADSTDSRQRGGTGLGLSISRTLIETMGGTIGFDSEPNKETVFWFTCPLAETSTTACVA